MSKETMKLLRNAIPTFSMLADENRQDLLMTLFDDGPQTVNQITEKIDISRPTVSHHLKLLSDAGLVKVKQSGRERFYDIDFNASIKTLGTLLESLKKDASEREF
jgi:DNA-binding transcriptional ArsR family regulator